MPIPSEAPAYRDLSDWVVLRILDAIRSGDIAPGERLVEHEVGARFGLSRAPVRDAFHKLEALGVVERVLPRGVSVRSWTNEDAAEVNMLMDAVILLSVQLALPRLTDEDFAALEASLAEARAAVAGGTVDAARQLELDLKFHTIITAAAGGRRLRELMDSLSLPLRLYATESYAHLDPASWTRIHDELLGHLRRRDRDAAVAAVLRNARQSEALFVDNLADRSPAATPPVAQPLGVTHARRAKEVEPQGAPARRRAAIMGRS